MSCSSALSIIGYLLRWNLSCDVKYALPVNLLTPDVKTYAMLLAFTLAIESPFYWWLARENTRARKITTWLLANLLTHPVVVFVILPYARAEGWTMLRYLIVAESFALLSEIVCAKFLLRTSWFRTVALITAANLVSWSVS